MNIQASSLQKRIITAGIGIPVVWFIIYHVLLTYVLILCASLILYIEAIYVWDISPQLKRNRITIIWCLYVLVSSYSMIVLNDILSRSEILEILGCIVVTEISAMFCGKIINGYKIYPSISPNKTISGSVGAIVVVSIIGFYMNNINLYIIICILEQIGDLVESYYKRKMKVKDTPGHGGLTDRLDGLLFISLLFYLFV